MNTPRTEVEKLIHRWKFTKRKMEFDLLQLGLPYEKADQICGAAQDEMCAIEKELSVPGMLETLDEVAGILEIATDIVANGGSTDEREVGLLKRACEHLYSVDDWGRARETPALCGATLVGVGHA